MTDVFISYKREDQEAVRPLRELLQRLGFDVWMDDRLHAGESFNAAINTELRRAKCVLVCWSKRSAQSTYVLAEAAKGFERGVIVPIHLEPTPLEVPFNELQTENLLGWTPGAEHPGFFKAIDGLAIKAGREPAAELARLHAQITARRDLRHALPRLDQWLAAHPNDPGRALAQELAQLLAPIRREILGEDRELREREAKALAEAAHRELEVERSRLLREKREREQLHARETAMRAERDAEATRKAGIARRRQIEENRSTLERGLRATIRTLAIATISVVALLGSNAVWTWFDVENNGPTYLRRVASLPPSDAGAGLVSTDGSAVLADAGGGIGNPSQLTVYRTSDGVQLSQWISPTHLNPVVSWNRRLVATPMYSDRGEDLSPVLASFDGRIMREIAPVACDADPTAYTSEYDPSPPCRPRSLAFSPTGDVLTFQDVTGSIFFTDAVSGQLQNLVREHGCEPIERRGSRRCWSRPVAFSPSGRWIVTTSAGQVSDDRRLMVVHSVVGNESVPIGNVWSGLIGWDASDRLFVCANQRVRRITPLNGESIDTGVPCSTRMSQLLSGDRIAIATRGEAPSDAITITLYGSTDGERLAAPINVRLSSVIHESDVLWSSAYAQPYLVWGGESPEALIDPETGELLWRASSTFSGDIVLTPDGSRIIVINRNPPQRFALYEPALRWERAWVNRLRRLL